jgi:hypothetical protein
MAWKKQWQNRVRLLALDTGGETRRTNNVRVYESQVVVLCLRLKASSVEASQDHVDSKLWGANCTMLHQEMTTSSQYPLQLNPSRIERQECFPEHVILMRFQLISAR